MTKEKIKCPVCNKMHETETWIETEGVMKGQRIVESAFCSEKCEKDCYDRIDFRGDKDE